MGRQTHNCTKSDPRKIMAVYSVEADGFTGSRNKASSLYAKASRASTPKGPRKPRHGVFSAL